MTARDLKQLLNTLSEEDLELEVMATDVDRSGIIGPISFGHIVTVKRTKEYAWSEWESCNFPIGHKFLKLD